MENVISCQWINKRIVIVIVIKSFGNYVDPYIQGQIDIHAHAHTDTQTRNRQGTDKAPSGLEYSIGASVV